MKADFKYISCEFINLYICVCLCVYAYISLFLKYILEVFYYNIVYNSVYTIHSALFSLLVDAKLHFIAEHMYCVMTVKI